MKKFSIKDLNIINKDEKINAIKLENKTEKFILYGCTNEKSEDNEFFSELKFTEEIKITPKKKIQSLNLSIEKEGEYNFIKIKGNKVYYLKDNDNVKLEKDNFKLFLQNGNLYSSSNIIKLDHKEQASIKKNNNDNLVKNILLKNKKTTTKSSNSSNKSIENNSITEPVSEEVKENTKLSKETTKGITVISEPIIEESKENTTVTETVVEESKENTVVSEPVIEESKENTTVTEPVVEETKENTVVSEPVVEETKENTVVSEPVVEETKENTVVSEPVVEETKENTTVTDPVIEETKENTTVTEPVVEETKENTTVTEPVVEETKEKYVDFETFQKNIIEKDEIKINKNINKEIKAKNDNNELYSLDQILNDFNKYYLDDNKNKANELIKKDILFFNKNYSVNLLEIESSKLNMQNLFKSNVKPKNIINDLNISIKLNENNSSYIILYLKNPYLFNKIDSKLIITNLTNKKSIVLSDNQYFKLNKIDFYIINNCSLLVPIINKSVNNRFGQRINFFEPLI